MSIAYSWHSVCEVIISNPSTHQFVPESIARYCQKVGDGTFDGNCEGMRDSDGDADGVFEYVDGANDTDGISDGVDDEDIDGVDDAKLDGLIEGDTDHG